MSKTWNCLYLHSDDAEGVSQLLQQSLIELGYSLYNPFGPIPGKAYPRSVRLFVAPTSEGWVKVVGAPDDAQFVSLSQSTPVLYAALDGTEADIRVYADGLPADISTVLTPYLQPDITIGHVQQALESTAKIIQDDAQQSGLPFDALPDDVKALAGNVNSGQAQKMFARLSGDLMKKVSKGDGQADAARALVSGGNVPDWNSTGGTRVRALMNCLTLPDDWREPDFDSLRDAFQLYERRRRSPNARSYPGDDEVMAKVPDALTYIPVYGGAS